MDNIRPRKYEFAVLVVIIGILALVVMGALERVRDEIEEASVQTEAAAIRAVPFIGRGDKLAADGAAVDAMRAFLHTVGIDGQIVIGEGEKDEAPMLYNGEAVGSGQGPAAAHRNDIKHRHASQGSQRNHPGFPQCRTIKSAHAGHHQRRHKNNHQQHRWR